MPLKISSPSRATALFLRFIRFLLAYRWQYLLAIALSGAVGLLSLINPWLTKLMVDKAIVGRDIRLFVVLAGIGGSLFLLGASARAFKSFLDHSLKLKTGIDINRAVYARIQDFPMTWFSGGSTGERVYALNYDVDRVRDFITFVPGEAALIFPQTILTLLIIARLDWKMAAFTVVLVPFLYGPYYYFNQKLRNSWASMIHYHESILKAQQEVLSHIKLVKAFHQRERCLQGYSRLLAENLDTGLNSALLEAKSSFCSQIISKVLLAMIGCYGIVQVIHGRMTLGTLSAVAVYLAQLTGLQHRFFNFFQTMIKGTISCERLAAILDNPDMAPEPPEAAEVCFQCPGIMFKDVSFGYVKEVPVLKRVNFSIKGGACVALVGPSGCGKSTLVGLLSRLYDSWEGEIRFDGHPAVKLKRASLLGQMGIALQEPLLWDDTVRNNIRYGCEDASEDEIISCARITGADPFIQRLPLGYDTVIGENACRLSEGQKQRIALARALIRKPRILILDEAISALDSESESSVFASLRRHYPETTLIYISHRLSMVMKADTVYYVKAPDRVVYDAPGVLWAEDKDFVALFSDQKMA